MKLTYVNVLERKLRWAAWWSQFSQSAGSPVKYSDTERHAFLNPLVNGETVVVEDEFCDLVNHAKLDIPDDLEFEESWMFTPIGLAWFTKPIELPRIKEAAVPSMRIQAVGWSRYSDGWQFTVYTSTDSYRRMGFNPWSWFGFKPGDGLLRRIVEYEAASAAKEDSASYDVDARTMQLNHEMRVVYAMLHLMSQRVAAHSRERASFLVRQQVTRHVKVAHDVPLDLRVVTLRHQAVEGHEAAQREVDWQCRWIVRGHWRRQPYKTTGLVKPIFIAAYVKGPEEKPLRIDERETVYVARR